MAKKQILNYKFYPGTVLPDINQFPNTVAILELNKKFLIEEVISFIQYNINNNISPYIFYTYNAEKCRRDTSYVIEAYISDIKKGGTWQTVSVASKYFENGIPQIDGDRAPEVSAHTFLRNLILNFVLENVEATSYQELLDSSIEIAQTVNLAYTVEPAGKTKLTTLSNIIINVIDDGLSQLPTPITNRGIVKFPGYYKLKDLLLITNTTRNTIIYNFADSASAADVTYSEFSDNDFPGALYGIEKITTVVLDVDTSRMMVTDNLQIFVEGKEQTVRLNSINTDAMERTKVGIPQSMLDADFEYGLQPTKWQAIALMRNYPSVYEIPGSDLAVVSVVTDASAGTAGSGSSLITVTTVNEHGFLVNSPFTIKALANSITGFSRAEGTFLVSSVPTLYSFTFYAKSKVGTTNGEQLSSTYTQLRKAGFYTGSAVGSPAFSVFSAGSNGSITTQLITPSGSDIIGFTGAPPPIGSPLSGTGITPGTQVTAITGSGGTAATTTLTVNGNIGDTSIQVNSLAGIGPGLVFDRGDGQSVAVTNIVGNEVSLSGALTSIILGTNQTYSNLLQNSTTGTGTNALFDVSRSGATYTTTVVTPGSRYSTNDTITILGTQLGGTAPTNTATITVTAASDKDTVSTLDNTSITGGSGYQNSTGLPTTGGSGSGLTVDVVLSGGTVTSATVATPGSNYTVGNTITIGGIVTGRIIQVGSLQTFGNGYVSQSNVACSGGSGSGATVDIVANDSTGSVLSVGITNGGTGYTSGFGPTTTLTGTGSGLTLAYTASSGEITGVFISATGSGYQDNDTVRIDGGGNNSVITITSASNGQVTSVTLNNGGQLYTAGNTLTIAASGFYLNRSGTNISGVGTGATFNINFSGGIYAGTINGGGTGYANGNQIRILGTNLGGTSPANDCTVTVTGVSAGVINAITVSGTPRTGNASFSVSSVATPATIQIASVSPGGLIQSVSTAGTPITAGNQNFISAFTINAPTTAQIASGNTGITFSAIGVIEVTFATAHGFVPGNTITVQITSSGANAQFAAGAYFVEQVPTSTTLRYTARAAGTIANTLTGILYGRPDSYFLHRPFDGGVQLGTGGPAHGASAIRMSKKYIRYQSGKGVMYNTGALFAPSYDIRNITSSGTSIGSTITVNLDDTDHGCQVGAQVTISGVLTTGYNGVYEVIDIVDERTFRISASAVLGNTAPDLDSPCQMTIRKWHGSTVRAGIFDDQNGMFYEYDGQKLYAVRRSSTFQVAGVIAVNANSNLCTGSNTRFTQQLASGDKIVIRGMTHTVTEVINDTQMTMAPDYRGVSNAAAVKICKIIDLKVAQEDWNNDPCNGTGPSGYNIDIGKMQMIGIQHTWYGAGFIDFMLRGADGNYVFAHRFRNSNVNTEAYMRTGNQPVRYEVVNEGARTKLPSNIDSSVTSIPLNEARYFPSSGIVLIDSELVRYTGNDGNNLTGCTRGATMTQFVAGAQRTFTGGLAVTHARNTGVVLVSNTITPIISHWGSAFLLDGQFDSDRGYIFNYAATGFSASTSKTTAFLIRLAPSVSNAQTGDLGERELLNRAQLLLSSISVTSDTGTGGIVVEGVLNPINYPEDPTKITWTTLNSQAAGGQPSFAQIASGGSVSWGAGTTTTNATVQGAFTTTLTATSFAPQTTSLTAISFSAVTYNVVAPSFSTVTSSTYARSLQTNRTDFLILQSSVNSLTTPIRAGDSVFNASFLNPARSVSSVTNNYISISGQTYCRIVMNNVASGNSNNGPGQDQTITVTSSIAATYGAALSNARTDFLITQAQASTTTATTTDVLSLATFLTTGQTISSITQNYATVSGTAYARIVMSSAANASSTSGSGNNQTITSTSAATARYASALSTGRNDFLITNAQASGAGIAIGDTLSIATFITGGQTITGITSSFITISSVTYTRITMSANANSSSPAGSGNNQSVTVTASGSAASYVNTNYLFFTSASWTASGAIIGTKIAPSYTQFPAGTTVTAISTRTFGAVTVYRVTFTQAATSSIASAATVTFEFGANYALPGEQVFSFISNPGETSTLSLEELKELTSTAIGGRGTFPNGPDVLAINVYKVAGTAVPANVILRWGEAQA